MRDYTKIVSAHDAGKFNEMFTLALEHKTLHPKDSNVEYLLGLAQYRMGNYATAINYLRSACTLKNANENGAELLLASCLNKVGQFEEAETILKVRLKKAKKDTATCINYAHILNGIEKYKESIRILSTCTITPEFANAIHINLGNAWRGLGNIAKAKSAYKEVINSNTTYLAEARGNMGALLLQEGKDDEARQIFMQMVQEGECHVEVYYNLAFLAARAEEPEETLKWIAKGETVLPLLKSGTVALYVSAKEKLGYPIDGIHYVHKFLNQHKIEFNVAMEWYSVSIKHCIFGEIVPASKSLMELITANQFSGLRNYNLFNLMACSEITADIFFKIAKRSQDLSLSGPVLPFKHSPRSHPRLRIGYLSPDFRDHPVAHLMIGIFANHDRDKFEVYGYNIGKEDHSVYRYRSIGYLDEFRECRELSFEDLARQIYDDEIDVLVDLCGYTEHCKPKALCYKPAPVIISYLGFVGTMGLPQVDYIIADSIVMPRALEAFHTEKPIRLPRCYQATDGTLEVERVSRDEMGLPEKSFVFVSFNNTYKLNPHFVGLWAEILHRCPEAVLWLYASGVAKDNLIAEFQRLGIESARLYFFTRQSKARFLGALALADLFLDSSPYNAGTTASDALFAGCPVLTLPGETYSSRMCASIVTHAGLPELVVDSEEAYVALACRMYADSTWRQAVRAKAEHARTSRLFDTVDATRCLEAAYRTAYDRFAAGKKPAPLTIPDPGWNGGDALRPFAGRRIGLEEAKGIAAKLETIGGTEAVEKLWQVLKPSPKSKTAIAGIMKKTVLHVGCGPQHILGRYGFSAEVWQECRLDIDPGVKPDVVSSMTDMSAVADGSVDAVYSSHNIEHLYAHEVPLALREFCRVLKDDGLLVLTCPDLQSVCALVAEGKLLNPAYHTGEGLPIAPLDILYGWRIPMAQGNLFMAHRCGFTAKVLSDTLVSCGFARVASMASPSTFALFAVASKSNRSEEEMRALATRHNML